MTPHILAPTLHRVLLMVATQHPTYIHTRETDNNVYMYVCERERGKQWKSLSLEVFIAE